MAARLLPALVTLALLATEVSATEPVRLASAAFGTSAEIEIRDLPRAQAEAAAREALRKIFEISRLVDPEGLDLRGLGALNAAAGQGPQPIEESVAEVLLRGFQICLWSGGAHGPLGGEIYRLWQGAVDGEDGSAPDLAGLRWAVASAACPRLALTGGETLTAEVQDGSRVDLRWMAWGFALDQAVSTLQAHGVRNAWLEIGPVLRAFGGGPDGEGWLVSLPAPPGSKEPLDQIWLQDQALAIASKVPEGAGVPLIDQRTGVPARGVVSVTVVTDRAMDAEALAATFFIVGQRDGQLRLGGFSPRPSIYWLLGEGVGRPLESTYRWSKLKRVPRRR